MTFNDPSLNQKLRDARKQFNINLANNVRKRVLKKNKLADPAKTYEGNWDYTGQTYKEYLASHDTVEMYQRLELDNT